MRCKLFVSIRFVSEHRAALYCDTMVVGELRSDRAFGFACRQETTICRDLDVVILRVSSPTSTNIRIKHVFSCINICQVPRRFWKPWPKATVFNTSLRNWRMLMHWKTMFDRYYYIKTENICYISRYLLHYFVSPFHRYLTNVISTDFTRSRAGQYTSRNGSKSVAPVKSYWKLRSRALTARKLPC